MPPGGLRGDTGAAALAAAVSAAIAAAAVLGAAVLGTRRRLPGLARALVLLVLLLVVKRVVG